MGEHRLRLDSIYVQYKKIQDAETAKYKQNLGDFMRKGISLILPSFTPQPKKSNFAQYLFPTQRRAAGNASIFSFALDFLSIMLVSSWLPAPTKSSGWHCQPSNGGHSCSLRQCGPWLKKLPVTMQYAPRAFSWAGAWHLWSWWDTMINFVWGWVMGASPLKSKGSASEQKRGFS